MTTDLESTDTQVDEPSELDLEGIPAWRRWVVQWDISHHAIPLAFFAFTSMWQTAANEFAMVSLPKVIWHMLFFTSCTILFITVSLFVMRTIIFPAAIVSDFRHPRLMNFFFMPVIVGALSVLTIPPFLRSVTLYEVSFYVLGSYQLTLAIYFFGEWLFGAHPPVFIHPLVFMQTIGFFLLAIIGARIHMVDQAWAMFSVGVLLWLLVFFTNFQHVSVALDKHREKPAPTFFLFIAPPAQAAIASLMLQMAKDAIDNNLSTSGFVSLDPKQKWGLLSQWFLYVDLFVYLLIFRLFPTFWTSKFSVAWWAYIFPLSAAATAVIWRYSCEGGTFWGILSAALGLIACVAMLVVLGFTLWSLWSFNTPNNAKCLRAYAHFYFQRQEDGHLREAMSSSRLHVSIESRSHSRNPSEGYVYP